MHKEHIIQRIGDRRMTDTVETHEDEVNFSQWKEELNKELYCFWKRMKRPF